MIRVDTNIVVRALMADDPSQTARVSALLEAGGVIVPITVLLEAEWVLRTTYRLRPPEVIRGFRALTALPGVAAEDPERLDLALDLAAEGFDLADAFHLAATPAGSTFVTFDRDLVRRAAARGLPAREP